MKFQQKKFYFVILGRDFENGNNNFGTSANKKSAISKRNRNAISFATNHNFGRSQIGATGTGFEFWHKLSEKSFCHMNHMI